MHAPAIPVGAALRRVFFKGYHAADLRADLMAGVVVGIVALPLSMALAIAVGVPPQHGLYTAIVAGGLVAMLGGCKFQVTGPTAAFVVILAPIVTKHGLPGLLTAGLMAGVMLVGMGVARLGRLIQFIPYPVTTGFTTGIAAVIATLQIKDVFGLSTGPFPSRTWKSSPRCGALAAPRTGPRSWLRRSRLLSCGSFPKIFKKIPAPLLAIGFVAVVAAVLHRFDPAFEVVTIGSRFHAKVNGVDVAGIPPILPRRLFLGARAGSRFSAVRELVPSAFAIAMLGAIESLLSAVIADGMTGHQARSQRRARCSRHR